MPIENETKVYIAKLAKSLYGGDSIELLFSNAEFYLKLPRSSERDIIILLPLSVVEDFDSALLNYKDTPYFYTIENLLKYNICSELVKKQFSPNLHVSDEMINEKGDWINPQVTNVYNVSFNSRMTKHLADGLKQILSGLDKILGMSEFLNLNDFKKHKEDVRTIYSYYDKHGNLNDPAVSVSSLQILKASAVCKIIILEADKINAKITRIAKSIDEEIYYIAEQMHDQLFFRIQIPEFMQSIKELYSQPNQKPINLPQVRSELPEDDEYYDIAFSLAHEQHEYVDDIYKNLKRISSSLNVFYYRDEIEEIKSWGKNQFNHLQKIYRDQSKHVIIFISKDYVIKRWARHEWRAVQEAILDRDEEYLLPVRFDDTDLPGLPSTIGYIDISQKTPEDFANIIVQKVGLQKTAK